MNVQLEACQKVLSANNNQLEKQSNTIKTLEVANSFLIFCVSILEADLAGQEQKNCNLESNLDRIGKLKDLVNCLWNKEKQTIQKLATWPVNSASFCIHAVYLLNT